MNIIIKQDLVDQYQDTIDDILFYALDINPNKAVITDISDLSDFILGTDITLEACYAAILYFFNVDVSHLNSMVEMAKYIEEKGA